MIDQIPLQAASGVCDPNVDPTTYLTNFEFIKAFACTYAASAGFLVVGMLVYGAVGLAIYIRTNSVVIPTVLLFITGGAVVTQIAAPVSAIIVLLLLGVPAGIIALAHRVYSR